MKQIKKLFFALAALLVCALFTVQAGAAVPYDCYTYSTSTGSATAEYSPVPYTPEEYIDRSTLGVPLLQPKDMCFDSKGNLYIVDAGTSSILVLGPDYKLIKKVDSFDSADGLLDFFASPEGIFVSDNGDIYVADTNQKRVVILDGNFKCKKIIKDVVPVNASADEYVFLPIKVGADSSGNIYVIARNENSGILQLDSDGKFISFVGSNKVAVNPVIKLWKKFMSKEQRAKLEQFVPIEYTNMAFDDDDFIYAVSKSTDTDTPIKRLNLAGKDVLTRNGYVDIVGDIKSEDTSAEDFQTSLFTDITPGENGLYYALDSTRGRIFVYNSDGFLFYAFGGMGNQLGTFMAPSAIEARGSDILVSDESAARITIFKRTEYGDLIDAADNYYNTGEYDKSVETWQKVINLNSNFELAYAQIGKVYLRQNKYEEAMEYFKLGNYRGDKVTLTSGYNKAFSEERRVIASEYLGPFVITVAVLIAGFYVFRRIRKHKKKSRTDIQ